MDKRAIVPNRWFIALDFAGSLSWIYLTFAVFFVDMRSIATALGGELGGTAYDFRFPLLLIVLASLVLLAGVPKFLFAVGYVALFPIIALIWKVPAILMVIGSWPLLIAVINSVISVFGNLRYSLIAISIYMVSMGMIAFGSGYVAAIGLAALLLVLILSYARSLWRSFSTPDFATTYSAVFDGLRNYCIKENVDEEEEYGPRGVRIAKLPEESLAKYRDIMQMRIAVSNGSLFFASKLEEYQKTQISVASGVLSTTFLLAITFVSFSFMYFAAEKLAPGSITGVPVVDTFEYVKIAFSNMLFGSIFKGDTTGPLIETLIMIQRVLTAGLIGIFFTLFLGVRNKKFEIEIQTAVNKIKKTSEETGQAVVAYHGYADVNDALADLAQAKGAFANFLIKMYTLASKSQRA